MYWNYDVCLCHSGEEPDGNEEDEQDNTFIDSQQQGTEDDGNLHRKVDALHPPDARTPFVTPYFPLALAVDVDRPLEFNFDLWLMDSLELPREICSREEQRPVLQDRESEPAKVSFHSSSEAMEYVRHKIMQGWSIGQEDSTTVQARLSHPGIDKWSLFKQHGSSLEPRLHSTQPAYDHNLRLVRMDRWIKLICPFLLVNQYIDCTIKLNCKRESN